MSEPEYEGLSRRQFEALVHALKMFVLLAVPEPRRTECLQICRRIAEAHSRKLDDPLQAFDQETLVAIDGLYDFASSLDRFERAWEQAVDDQKKS